MRCQIADYTTLVFDCDGVLLDTNKIKTEAFYQATLPYGEDAAQAMVEYHLANGGVSRYKKFAHFLKNIIPDYASQQQGSKLETLLQIYTSHVREGVLSCDSAPGLEALRQKTLNARWMIVSGGDQIELRDIFAQRGIAQLFDGGIFGSPDTKDEILAREMGSGTIEKPALFLGDSKYDYQAASVAGLDFVFLSKWSEVENWQEWCTDKSITSFEDLKSVMEKVA